MSSRRPLSACVLALDARESIEACVQSLWFADEVLVLDSGSTDGTPELCRRLGARVEGHPFDDYATQRNHCARLAAHDWVLFVDADERVSPELAESVRAALDQPEMKEAGFLLRRRNFYLGRWLRHGAWEPDLVARLYDRRRGRWEGQVHERLLLDGGRPRRVLDGALEHRSFRSLADQVERLNRYSTLSGDDGSRWPLLQMLLRPPLRFLRAYVLKLGFLEGRVGLVQAGMSAFAAFLKYAKQLEHVLAQPSRRAGA